jgi:hypothetical protein
VAATSPVHGRRCGEGHDGASSVRGCGAARARGIDGGAVKATAPRLTGKVSDGGVRTMRRGRRRGHVRLGGDRRGGGGSGRSASVEWHVEHARSGADIGAASDSDGRRRRVVGMRAAVGTDARGPDSAFKARRGRVIVTRRRRADRRPGAVRGRLTGGSHVSMIFELKFTLRQK